MIYVIAFATVFGLAMLSAILYFLICITVRLNIVLNRLRDFNGVFDSLENILVELQGTRRAVTAELQALRKDLKEKTK